MKSIRGSYENENGNPVIDVHSHFTTPEYLKMMERHGKLLQDPGCACK